MGNRIPDTGYLKIFNGFIGCLYSIFASTRVFEKNAHFPSNSCKKVQKEDFRHHLEWAAPKPWLKYTTQTVLGR